MFQNFLTPFPRSKTKTRYFFSFLILVLFWGGRGPSVVLRISRPCELSPFFLTLLGGNAPGGLHTRGGPYGPSLHGVCLLLVAGRLSELCLPSVATVSHNLAPPFPTTHQWVCLVTCNHEGLIVYCFPCSSFSFCYASIKVHCWILVFSQISPPPFLAILRKYPWGLQLRRASRALPPMTIVLLLLCSH